MVAFCESQSPSYDSEFGPSYLVKRESNFRTEENPTFPSVGQSSRAQKMGKLQPVSTQRNKALTPAWSFLEPSKGELLCTLMKGVGTQILPHFIQDSTVFTEVPLDTTAVSLGASPLPIFPYILHPLFEQHHSNVQFQGTKHLSVLETYICSPEMVLCARNLFQVVF